MTKKHKAIDAIVSRKHTRDGLPSSGTPVSVIVNVDGKLNSLDGDLIDTTPFHAPIAGYFLAADVPSEDDPEVDVLAITYINAAHVISVTWYPDDDKQWSQLVSVTSTENAEDAPQDTVSESESNTESDTADDDATPRARILSQLNSSPAMGSLRSIAANTARLTQ